MKKVYTCFCTDVIYESHLNINIIHKAKKHEKIILCVLSYEEKVCFNHFSTLSFNERIQFVKNVYG